MAKTRIKTTPMRIHKDALMAIATAATNEQSKKKSPPKLQRMNCTRAKQKQEQEQLGTEPPQSVSNNGQQHRTTTIIMPKCAYTTISSASAFASISQTSDTQSVNSGTESPTAIPTPSPPPPPPPPPPAAAAAPLTTKVGDYITHFSEPQEIIPTHPSTLVPAMNQLSKFNNSHHQTNQVLLEAITSSGSTTATAIAKPSAFSKLLQNAQNNMNLTSNGDANRKVYMITADDVCTNGAALANGQPHGQKRKMLLIMEENTSQNGVGYGENYGENGQYGNGEIQNNGGGGGGDAHALHNLPPMKKKLTLFANKSDRDLTQKFEKILPEIISRIHAKTNGASLVPLPAVRQNGGNTVAIAVAPKVSPSQQSPQFAETVLDNGRLPLTLPPKKNRTKIITSSQQLELISDNAQHYQQQPNQSPQQQQQYPEQKYPIIQISAATPVIVENSNLINHKPLINHNNHNNNNSHNHHNHTLSRDIKNNIKTYAVQHHPSNGTAQHQLVNCNGGGSSTTAQCNKNIVIVGTSDTPPSHPSTPPSHCNNMSVLMTAAQQLEDRKPSIVAPSTTTTSSTHKNINLSTDFLFLMKMLPKLESIPEPNKGQVKNYIEQIITQNSSN